MIDRLPPARAEEYLGTLSALIAREPIVDKRFRDAFRETDLHDVLVRAGVDHVIVTGIQTEYCVDATLREAERRGYRVTLVSDGTATFDVEGATEAQIRAQVHRVAQGRIADIVPSAALFNTQAEETRCAS